MSSKLVPYIFFYGRCAEALEFYKGVFGGSYEAMRVSDSPMASEMPPEAADSIMHASFTADGIAFMASDGASVKPVDPDAGNVSMALSFEDAASGERAFDALAAGGKVVRPIEDAFWGGRFGMLTDKFGTEWMCTVP